MFVDPDKPLPPAGAKVDTLGSVLEAIIEIGNARAVTTGDADEFEQRVTDALTDANKAIDGFKQDALTKIDDHKNKQGAVHGETKDTVGLGKKENWPMATIQEHLDGKSKDTFCHPQGLALLARKFMTLDPTNYIRSRLMPIASGGQLGNVPQWPFNWKEGEVVESINPAMDYYTETPWQFSTDQGVRIYPAMNGSDILTQKTPDVGRARRAVTPWGGTDVRVYNNTLDLRRSRPGVLRAESNVEPNDQLLKGSPHLFDRHCVYYAEEKFVKIRAFNKIRLPFDTLESNGTLGSNWSGIVESRESTIYNITTTIQKTNTGHGNGIWLIIELDLYHFDENGIASKNGPGNPAEVVARLGDVFNVIKWQVGNDKFKIMRRAGKTDAICLNLNSLLNFTNAQMEALWDNINHSHAQHVAFTWLNRLNGDFAIRVPIGFYTKDKKNYINYYMDIGFNSRELPNGGQTTVTINSLRDIDTNIQTLDDNFQVKPTGRFIEYSADVAGDTFHPLVFNGIFESLGGHIKTYTYYNRQYVGYYQHNVGSVEQWIANGDEIKPKLVKYNYGQISTLNQDGLYGDHLRHIPLGVRGDTADYLTLSRDWNNQYRWCIVNANLDTLPIMESELGHPYGPWRNSLTWMNPSDTRIPDFLIVNEENSSTFDTSCLVFNTQNKFKGFAKFSYDTEDTQATVIGVDPVSVDDVILNHIATLGGGWSKHHRQLFYFQNRLYFFSQCLSAAEWPADNVDCYYGWIDGAFIDVEEDGKKVIKINGKAQDRITSKPLKVNNKKSATAVWDNVIGRDPFDSTDTYLMLMARSGTATTYKLMVNLAPHNNFYFEFELKVDTGAGTTSLIPDPSVNDPVFPYNATTGYNVDYEAISAYKTLVPHHLHVNFQTPVMLKKSMWSYRKTPGLYGIFSPSVKTTIINGGLMNSIQGTNIYPLGSLITIGGGNTVVKVPVDAADKLYPEADELFVRQNGTLFELYGRNNNPNNYETEPNAGVVPCGFLNKSTFTHYDLDGWRNSLLPVIDGLRMNFYGYGSSFPAFMGVYGAHEPVNRFFLNIKGTTLKWDTAQGRVIPVTGSNAFKINGNVVAPTGTTTFTIPASYTGVVEIEISGLLELKWAKGLTEIVEIGTSVQKLNFKNSTDFIISGELPGSVTELNGVWEGAVGENYAGIENWDVSYINSMEGTFKNTTKFNRDLSKWNTKSVTSMKEMFMGAKAFNQPVAGWDTSSLTTAESMFEATVAFNQPLNGWNTDKLANASKMFKDSVAFDGAMDKWLSTAVVNLSYMFQNAKAFRGLTITRWNTQKVTNVEGIFKGTQKFLADGGSLDYWKLTICSNMSHMFEDSYFNGSVKGWGFGPNADLSFMFAGTKRFDQPLSQWNVQNVRTARSMFQFAEVFNQDLKENSELKNHYDWFSCTSFNSMFYGSKFNKSVEGWQFARDTDAPAKTGIDMNYMFAFTSNFDDPSIENWDMQYVTSTEGMFKNCNLFNRDLSKWNMSRVKNMSYMFTSCKVFDKSVNDWDVSNLLYARYMFSETPFFNQPLDKWKTTSLQTIQGMFRSAKLFDQDISMWDVSKVADFSEAFQQTGKFNQDLSGWNTESATTMRGMFDAATAIGTKGNKFNIANWNTDNVTSAGRMFAECNYNASVANRKWGRSCDLTGMFQNAPLFNQPLTGWVVNDVRYVKNMFYGATAFNSSVADLNWEKCEDHSGMFEGATAFNQDLSTWQFNVWLNSSLPTATMFKDCKVFQGTGLSKWNTINFTNTNAMFQGCPQFNEDISVWNLKRSVNISYMFDGCSSFNRDLNGWDVSKATVFAGVFRNCSMFNGDISNWNVSNANDMTSMFQGATNFKGDISKWVTKGVTRFIDMFNTASAFNTDISKWDVANCFNFTGMFMNAVSFNKNISGWNMIKSNVMWNMFNGASSFNQPIGSWNTTGVDNMNAMFNSALAFNQDLSKWDVSSVNKHVDFDTNTPAWVAPKPNFTK